MSYLTRAKVPVDRAARFHLADNYRWHQAVWKTFPDQPDDGDRPFLFRVDALPEHFRVTILSSPIPTRADWCPEDAWATRPLPEELFEHARHRFALRANPVKSVKDGGPERGKRTAILAEDELRGWMERQAAKHGFALRGLTVSKPRRERFRKSGTSGFHNSVDFDGILSVENEAAFRHAVLRGIGPAKSFGFGLLQLAPLNE